ncbi:MAG: CoA transferase [Chloroflexota bacterium]
MTPSHKSASSGEVEHGTISATPARCHCKGGGPTKPPLHGIRIVDFGQTIIGPWAAQLLAIMGAEVIKVESHENMDTVRSYAPFANDVQTPNSSALFNNLNFSKKSCTLNLKHPEGIRLAKQLVSISDIAIENFSVGVMDRLGLAYEALRQIKPDIIMVSCSFVGQGGPHRNHRAYGNTAQAYSSLTALTGYLDGKPRGLGGTWADPVGGEFAALAALAALLYRQKTGKGQFIDVSMTEAILTMLPEAIMDYATNDINRTCMGNRDDLMAPHGVYRCRGDDRWVAIAVSTEQEWRSLAGTLGSLPWTNDKRFSHMRERLSSQDELDSLITTWTSTRTNVQVMEALQQAGVAAGPCFDQQQLVDNHHLRERELLIEVDHPEAGRRLGLRLPWRTSEDMHFVYGHAPLLGQHNEYVFCQLLGLSKDAMSRLVEEKVIH